MTAQIIHLPIAQPPAADDHTIAALAVHNHRLYTRGAPGWICIKGSPHGPDYHHWLDTLPDTAVIIREGL